VPSISSEMIYEVVMTIQYRLTIDDIIDAVHVFPTMTEALLITKLITATKIITSLKGLILQSTSSIYRVTFNSTAIPANSVICTTTKYGSIATEYSGSIEK
jgi:hypothetical protein